MNTDINANIDLIQESIKWADKFEKEGFPRELFRKYRRQLKTIRDSLSENCSAAAYGESQVGKSYLMSSLLSSPDTPFVIRNNGKDYTFIDQLNPSGGETTQKETTGVITRFTIRKDNNGMEDFVKIKNLSVVDIILLLTDSYYNDVQIDSNNILMYDDINKALVDLSAIWESKATSQSYICDDDIADIEEYIERIIGHNAVNVQKSNFRKTIEPVIQYIPVEKWVDIFSLLWNRNQDYNNLFSSLINEYSKINFATDIYVPFDTVLKKYGTLLKIEWLDTVCGCGHHLEEGERAFTDIYNPQGRKIATDFSKGYLSALIGEITFVLPESLANNRNFLKKIDLLDFPGARTRERIKEEDLRPYLPLVLRRGKVAYLFNKYSRSLKISSVLFCLHNHQKNEPTVASTIESWINDNIGKTPEERLDMLDKTNRIAPLFMICTKFNMELERTKNDKDATTLESHWARFKTSIPEMIKEKWLDDWIPADTRGSKYFQNIYLLRDFYWSGKRQVFDGYDDSIGSPEKAVHSFPDYQTYFEDLKKSFLDNPFVKKHFSNPDQAWDDVATINNDGSKAIIRNLDAIAQVLDNARNQKYANALKRIKNQIIDTLNTYYVSEDETANNAKVRNIVGDLKLRTQIAFGEKPERFGRILDSMMISPSSIREIAYDIIVRHTDVPEIVSSIKMIRAQTQINPEDDKSVNIRKLCKAYYKNDEAELKECFKEQGIDLEDIISDKSELMASVPDVITKHTIEYWANSINQKVKELDYLPHADDLAFMLLALLQKLAIKKKIADSISNYYEVFEPKNLPNVISDYLSLTLNNFVSTVGIEYMDGDKLKEVSKKAEDCKLSITLPSQQNQSDDRPQSLIDALHALDESSNLINNAEIDLNKLRKLPFWDNYQNWINLISIGLLYTNDIADVNPEANNAMKALIDRCIQLYQSC